MAHYKKRHPSFEPLTLRFHGQRPTCYRTTSMFFLYIDRDWYVSVRTNRRLDILTKKRKQNPLPGDDASTAGRIVRDEHKVRHIEQTPHQMVDLISS